MTERFIRTNGICPQCMAQITDPIDIIYDGDRYLKIYDCNVCKCKFSIEYTYAITLLLQTQEEIRQEWMDHMEKMNEDTRVFRAMEGGTDGG